MFGIDQQVQQRIDAYRGNPQKLQQQYAQKKDIFDLIALNRITEEQESAANQMRLDAAKKGTLPSIYAQKESQALDNAKKEVIDEQAGIMQNKMRQMQEAQKKVLQSAGAPPMPGQATPQPQQPPSAGLAGLPAPNIQGMAGGGIVAFDQGGSTGEEEARRAMEERRQRQAAPQPVQQAAPQGGMQAGLARLLGIDPEAIYQRRNKEAAEAANFNAVERAGYARQADEKKALFDQNRANRALIGMAGYSTPALAIAAGGGQAINDEDRFMRERQSDERKLIDIGPASRMAGMKAGETAYGHGMTGLTSGVDAAAKMAATGEMAATRAQGVKDRLTEMGEKRRAEVLLRVEGLVTNDPQYKNIVKATEMAENVANMAPTPQNITRRDTLRREQSTFYNQMFRDKLQHHLPNEAGNTGTAPPAGPAPIDWNSMPSRRP
jgi:hypothetical protein